jgi:hypothetical protein
LPDNYGLKTPQASAVEKVIKKLWDSPSSSEGMVGNSTTLYVRKGHATDMDNHLEQLTLAVRTKTVEREASSPQACSPPDMVKDRSASLPAQGSSQEQGRGMTESVADRADVGEAADRRMHLPDAWPIHRG